MVESISFTMVTLMLAIGNIRNYQLIVGGCQLLNFPLAYVLLKLGYIPESTIILSIVIAFVCLVLRLLMLKRMINFPVRQFIYEELFKIIFVGILSAILPCILVVLIEENIFRLFLSIIVSITGTLIIIYLIGCNKYEKQLIISKLVSLKQRHKDENA